MGNIFCKNKYRILNDDCLIELEPIEFRHQLIKLQDEVNNLKSIIRLLEDKHITDNYNNTERMTLVQRDLELLVNNDKLLFEEIKVVKNELNELNELINDGS
jgi:hypothetical protein